MIRFTLLCSTFAAIAAAANAMSEEVVTFSANGQEVVGTLARPDGDPAPVVLMLHGFTGSRDELQTEAVPEGVFARSAKALADAGMASLRIDFRGSGDSTADLSFADTTFEGQVSDALAALEYLETLDQVHSDDIYLIGWSQGGLVGTAVAGRSDALDAVALWAAPADPESTFGTLLDAATMEKALAGDPDEAVKVTLSWTEIELKRGFFEGIQTFDPVKEISAYSGPLLVVQGSADTTVTPENADMLIAAHEGPEQLWVAEMDHVFNIFATNETLDLMLSETIGFFKTHDD